mmetsp:Transcript_82322/g.164092  ORF Transcript_82322/g.164092 Transcript_82322/m.164092 type:complete len:211 (+) Transcript_82322:864-1496(+)
MGGEEVRVKAGAHSGQRTRRERRGVGMPCGFEPGRDLAKVARARRLDDATPPPAAPLHVRPWLAAHYEIRPRAVLAAARARLPRAGSLVRLVHAAVAVHQASLPRSSVDRPFHIVQVVRAIGEDLGGDVGCGGRRPIVQLAARHRVEWRRKVLRLVPAGTHGGAPAAHVPARRLWQEGARSAKEWGGGAVPACARPCDLHHLWVDLALEI